MKIDGKQIAQNIFDNLKERIGELKKENVIPHLAIILVGDDPASVAYVNQKKIKAEQVGALTTIKHFPSETSTETLLEAIQKFNDDKNIHGIIVQQPLPAQINLQSIIDAVKPEKDVDGFLANSPFQMPLAEAVMEILGNIYSSIGVAGPLTDWLKSQKIVVMGKGKTGGEPIIQMFKKLDIEPTIVDSKTLSPEKLTSEADIIVCAVGRSNTLRPEMIKKGVILISIGISRGESAKLMGDYDQNKVENIAAFYTPTPGGVGPVNVACLLNNLVLAAEKY